MSRHKLVKALNLDEELDDFDGVEEDGDEEEELSPEDKEHLRRGTVDVRKTLGPDFPVSDQDIEDSLYYYYYDIQKTVNYLLNQNCGSKSTKSKRKKSTGEAKEANDITMTAYGPRLSMASSTCQAPIWVEIFFKDSPWLKVPRGRRADILIEPLFPRGGLLGGSLKQDGGKPKSKLAALAAARKQKENQILESNQEQISSVALLDKLGAKTRESAPTREAKPAPSEPSRRYPVRKQKSPDRPPIQQAILETTSNSNLDDNEKASVPVLPPLATPSVFATTMFAFSMHDRGDFGLQPVQPFYSNRSDTNLEAFADPSPDDIVLKAQSSASKGPKATKAISQVTPQVNDLTLNETPKVKSKHLDVLNEFEKSHSKPSANFVVIGHVDAGKSTLMGRLLHDLKVVDQRTIEKYRKEAENIGKSSFALAWVMDQGTEERERGVTIDTANHQFSTANTTFTILDAPGHRDFIPNMIAGASQADFAVLVIDASTGNFESGLKGQTKEHTLLVRSMGVQRLIVAVNKLDTLSWSQSRFDEISQQTSAFLTAAGFLAKNISFVPCSGLTGDNIVNSSTVPSLKWYTGPPLLSLLESSEPISRALSKPISRALSKPLRITIDDVFRGTTQSPLSISGRIDAGSVQVADTILILPASQTATIKSLDRGDGDGPIDWAVAGQNVVLHLSDIEAKFLRPGDIICAPTAPIPCIKSFTVKLLAFEHVLPMHIELHKGRLHVSGRIVRLVAVLDKSTGEKGKGKGKRPKLIRPGEVARVEVEVDEAVPLEGGRRVVLRAEGATVGAGLVE